MTRAAIRILAALTAVVLASGCAKKDDSPIDKAVESTKDALDLRDHEKLKDAAEEARDAVKDAGAGMKDAAREAADEMKSATKDATRNDDPGR